MSNKKEVQAHIYALKKQEKDELDQQIQHLKLRHKLIDQNTEKLIMKINQVIDQRFLGDDGKEKEHFYEYRYTRRFEYQENRPGYDCGDEYNCRYCDQKYSKSQYDQSQGKEQHVHVWRPIIDGEEAYWNSYHVNVVRLPLASIKYRCDICREEITN